MQEMSDYLGPVRNKPERIENAALFPSLRLGLPSTLIRHENRAFRKRSSNQRILKTPAWRFSVGRKQFENGAFQKTVVMSSYPAAVVCNTIRL